MCALRVSVLHVCSTCVLFLSVLRVCSTCVFYTVFFVSDLHVCLMFVKMVAEDSASRLQTEVQKCLHVLFPEVSVELQQVGLDTNQHVWYHSLRTSLLVCSPVPQPQNQSVSV